MAGAAESPGLVRAKIYPPGSEGGSVEMVAGRKNVKPLTQRIGIVWHDVVRVALDVYIAYARIVEKREINEWQLISPFHETGGLRLSSPRRWPNVQGYSSRSGLPATSAWSYRLRVDPIASACRGKAAGMR